MLNQPESSLVAKAGRAAGPFGVRAWTLLCALLSATGWFLSALKCLNAVGYAVALVVIGGILFLVLREDRPARHLHRWQRRWKRPFAAGFLILTLLALLGGVLYAPVFFDGLAYRTTRVLNWIAAGQWWWIPDHRGWLNTRAVAYEWVTAPVLALLKTDRCLFLINIISFLMLPGLTFSLLTRCGVGRRVAWYWMWLLPTGYGYLLQAGSIGNDLFGAVFAMAAVDFALRARQTGRVGDLMFSILAVALLTGSKTSNLPLLLPWFLVAMFSWRLLFKNVAIALPVVGLAALCSFLPVAVNNHRHCGDWTGQAAEDAFSGKNAPALYMTRGGMLLILQNLTPPVLPLAGKVESAINQALPERMAKWLAEDEPVPGWGRLTVREMVAEEDAGFGFGLTLLLLAQIFGPRQRTLGVLPASVKQRGTRFWWVIAAATLFSLFFFLSKSGLTTAARTVIPYYALLVPFGLVISGVEAQVRTRWWKAIGAFVFLCAGLAVMVIPERPLWPALTVLKKLEARKGSPTLARAVTVYETYRNRADVLSPLVAALPHGIGAIGLIGITEPEASLWRPFGSRTVYHTLADTTPEDLAQRGIEWVVVNADTAPGVLKQPLAEWLARFNARVEQTFSIRVYASGGMNTYHLVRIETTPAQKNRRGVITK